MHWKGVSQSHFSIASYFNIFPLNSSSQKNGKINDLKAYTFISLANNTLNRTLNHSFNRVTLFARSEVKIGCNFYINAVGTIL